MDKTNLDSKLLFHGTTKSHFDRTINEKGLYLPGARPEIYLSEGFEYSLSYALQRSAEYKDKPILLAMDKSNLIDCNLIEFSVQNKYSYYTCNFLKPEWFKFYEYSQNKNVDNDKEILMKISKDFPVLFSKAWGKGITPSYLKR